VPHGIGGVDKMTTYREHLVREIPNNRITRWVIKHLNSRMATSDSKFRLHIRYRKPKIGGYGRCGDVEMKNAKCFSLYLRKTSAAKKQEVESRELANLRFEVRILQEKQDRQRRREVEGYGLFAYTRDS